MAAAHLCSEQSTAQWKRVDVDEDYRPRHAAKVVELKVEARLEAPSYVLYPSVEGPVHACHARIAHPHRNFGPRLPNLISAVLGEGAYFAPGNPIVKLLDIGFPASFLAHFAGPRLGQPGCASCYRYLIGRCCLG